MATPAGAIETDPRTRLREAALELFGRQGVDATSTREIVAAAGLRNPSAISYHFGSKARLIDDLLREVNRDQSAIIQQQVAIAAASPVPVPDVWAEAAVNSALELLETERGCLLVRVWADRDETHPDTVEEFLGGDHPLATAWRAAVTKTFPDVPPAVAIARCVVVLRTLQWITVRRARGIVLDVPAPVHLATSSDRAFLLELCHNILTAPSTLTGRPPSR